MGNDVSIMHDQRWHSDDDGDCDAGIGGTWTTAARSDVCSAVPFVDMVFRGFSADPNPPAKPAKP